MSKVIHRVLLRKQIAAKRRLSARDDKTAEIIGYALLCTAIALALIAILVTV
jgi:Flp pilus assembly pilin Flp